MGHYFGIRQTKWFLRLLVLGIVIGLAGYGVYASLQQFHYGSKPTTITKDHLTPLQKVTVGKPLPSNLKSTLKGFSQTTDKDGTVYISYDSPILMRPNLIAAKKNVVVFERVVTPVDPSQYGFAHLSEYTQNFGSPEKEVLGSKTYGSYFVTAIYASKGFTIIANPNTDTVFEFQRFLPMSVDDYTSTYGQDLAPISNAGGKP